MKKILFIMTIICAMMFSSVSLADEVKSTSTHTYYFFHSCGALHGHGVREVAQNAGRTFTTCCGSKGAIFLGEKNNSKWWDFVDCFENYPNKNDLRIEHIVTIPWGAQVTDIKPVQKNNVFEMKYSQEGDTVRISFIPGMMVDGVVENNQIPKIKSGYGYNMYTTIAGGGDLHTSSKPSDNTWTTCPGTPYCNPQHTGNKEVKITNLLNEGGGIGLFFEYKFDVYYTFKEEVEVTPEIKLYEYQEPWEIITNANSKIRSIGVQDISTDSYGYQYKAASRLWEVKRASEPESAWKQLKYRDLTSDSVIAFYTSEDDLLHYHQNPSDGEVNLNSLVTAPHFTYQIPEDLADEDWLQFQLTITDNQDERLPPVTAETKYIDNPTTIQAKIEIKDSNDNDVSEDKLDNYTIITVEDVSTEDGEFYNSPNRSWEIRINGGKWRRLNFDNDSCIKEVYSRADKTKKITIEQAKAENPDDSIKSNLQQPKFTYLLSNPNSKYEFRLNIRDEEYNIDSDEDALETNSGIMSSTHSNYDVNAFNIINSNDDYVTDRKWESIDSPVNVKLVPSDETKKTTKKYTWNYKEGEDGKYIFFSNKVSPSYPINHGITYYFQLITDSGKEEEHYTSITSGPVSVYVDLNAPSAIDLSSETSDPVDINIHMYNLDYYISEEDSGIQESGMTSTTLTDEIIPEYWNIYLIGENIEDGQKWLLKSDGTSERYTETSSPTISNFPIGSKEADFIWKTSKTLPTNKISKTLKFTVIAKLKTNIGQHPAQNSKETILYKSGGVKAEEGAYSIPITVIDNLAPDNAKVIDAGDTFNLTLDYAETEKLELDAEKNIFSGVTDKATINPSGAVTLAKEGDYDSTSDRINRIHVTAIHPDGTHTAKQDITIKPNWYISPDPDPGSNPPPVDPTPPGVTPGKNSKGNGDNSALKVVSTRDLRWQPLFKTNSTPKWGLSTKNANEPLLPNEVVINGVKISPIKTGYAVEFTFDTTKVFNEKPDDNIQINVSFKKNGKTIDSSRLFYQNNYGAPFNTLDSYYKSFNLDNATAKTKFNITKTTRPDGGATYRFLYYLPGTLKVDKLQPQAGDRLDVYFNISARCGTTEYFNYNALTKDIYKGWDGWVFSYDLTKNNLQDFGSNSN